MMNEDTRAAALADEVAETTLVDELEALTVSIRATVERAQRKAALRAKDGRRLSARQYAELRQARDVLSTLIAVSEGLAASTLTQEELRRIADECTAALGPRPPRSVQ